VGLSFSDDPEVVARNRQRTKVVVKKQKQTKNEGLADAKIRGKFEGDTMRDGVFLPRSPTDQEVPQARRDETA
jgi:hypothetical protein